MALDWKSKIDDPKERKVFEALADPKWDFRTIEGISETTGVSKPEVKHILRRYPKLVRESPVPDRQGRQLFTLRSRPQKAQELMSEFRSFVTKTF
jgi:hypothetical protein